MAAAPAAAAAGPPQWAFVLYAEPGPALWHQRLILGSLRGSSADKVLIMTPDYDVYLEDYNLNANVDVLTVRRSAVRWPPPAGVPRGAVYRFAREPNAVQMAQAQAEAVTEANREFLEEAAANGRPVVLPAGGALEALPAVGAGGVVAQAAGAVAGAVAGGGAVAVPAAAGVGAAVAGGAATAQKWVVAESSAKRTRGDDVTLDGTETLSGRRGLKTEQGEEYFIYDLAGDDLNEFKGAEAFADARLLAVETDARGRKRRAWREVVSAMSQVAFTDWPVPGPRTMAWCAHYLDRRGGGPLDHHQWWKSVHGLRADSWGVVEHETALRSLEHAGCYDNVDVSNVAALEVVVRRVQLIEYAYAERRGVPKGKGKGKANEYDSTADRAGLIEESAVFSGIHRENGEMMVAPELLEYVSKEIEKDASIMKQIRKARDERKALAGEK